MGAHILLGSCESTQRRRRDREALSPVLSNEIHLSIFSLDKLFLPTFSSCVYFDSLDFEAIVISSSSHLGQRCFNRQLSSPVHIEKWKLAKENFPFLSAENFPFRSCPRKIFYKWKSALRGMTIGWEYFPFVYTVCSRPRPKFLTPPFEHKSDFWLDLRLGGGTVF